MAKFYFTFGLGQPSGGFCQPVEAEDAEKARQIMVRYYGYEWSMQYTEDSWQAMKNNKHRRYPLEKELPVILGTG